MPFLPIDSSINSMPSRPYHLSIIAGWMLWPDDETKRKDANAFAVVAAASDLMHHTEPTGEVVKGLFHLAKDAMRPDDMKRLAGDRGKRGMMAGNILIAAVEGQGRLKLGDIHKKLTKLFAPQNGWNSSRVSGIWTRFRPVCHLWAAFNELDKDRGARGPLVFPCRADEVIDFLWLSEEWRKKGESTKTALRAPTTVLRPGECIRVPEEMKFSN